MRASVYHPAETPTGHDKMDVRVETQISRPSLQHADCTDFPADKTWISSQLLQGFCTAAKEQVVDGFLVAAGNGSQPFG